MIFVSEASAIRLVTLRDAITAVESAFVSLDRGVSTLMPAVTGAASHPGTRISAKGGFDGGLRLPGVKVGTYWPSNGARGLASHGSTTLLLDGETGFPRALVAATYLTALRTAAADAVAVKYLAGQDASVLAVVGTGHQAYYDALAISEVRSLERIWIAGRTSDGAERLAARLRELNLLARSASLDQALRAASIVTTVTAATQAIVDEGCVRPGAHVSTMGSDGPGKQELSLGLVSKATLFADLPSQSVVMGEFRSAHAEGLIDASTITPLGAVADGRLPGRSSPDEITIFDSSGIALQDIAIAGLALERALAEGLAEEVNF
jgi:ornithine cyclodeaminase